MAYNLKGKIVWKVTIRAETGLHVGGSASVYEIGAPDSPVVKDPVTGEPYIPGSSVKGKLRSLLEARYLDLSAVKQYHASGRSDGDIKKKLESMGFRISKKEIVQFEDCAKYMKETGKDVSFICRLFGQPGNKEESEPTRLQITDFKVINWGADNDYEIKGENALDRVTSAANPRFIERVPPGTKFEGYIIMNVYENIDLDDIKYLEEALELLVRDYIGGHGTRGYGRVSVKVDPPEFYPPGFGTDDVRSKAAALSKEYNIGE